MCVHGRSGQSRSALAARTYVALRSVVSSVARGGAMPRALSPHESLPTFITPMLLASSRPSDGLGDGWRGGGQVRRDPGAVAPQRPATLVSSLVTGTDCS